MPRFKFTPEEQSAIDSMPAFARVIARAQGASVGSPPTAPAEHTAQGFAAAVAASFPPGIVGTVGRLDVYNVMNSERSVDSRIR